MDGIETAKTLFDQYDIPSIFMTAHSDSLIMNRALGSKPLGYITKPFNSTDIIGTIESALIRNNLEKELKQHSEDLEFMQSLSNLALKGESFDALCSFASGEIRKIFSSFGTAVSFLDSTNNILILKKSSTANIINKKIEKILNSKIPDLKLSLNNMSIYREVITKRKSILLTEPDTIKLLLRETVENSLFKENSIKKLYMKLVPNLFKIINVKSIILIPLINEKKIFGIISVSFY